MNNINETSYLVRKAIFEVKKELGPGLLESVYQEALIIELISLGLKVQCQVKVPVYYKSQPLGLHYFIDILVNDCIIVEVKSVQLLTDFHKKQVVNYLNLSKKDLGILVNFNSEYLIDKEDLIRIIRKR